jgi:hypothetical protein
MGPMATQKIAALHAAAEEQVGLVNTPCESWQGDAPISLETHLNKVSGVQQGVIEFPYLLERLSRLPDPPGEAEPPTHQDPLLQPPRLQSTSKESDMPNVLAPLDSQTSHTQRKGCNHVLERPKPSPFSNCNAARAGYHCQHGGCLDRNFAIVFCSSATSTVE